MCLAQLCSWDGLFPQARLAADASFKCRWLAKHQNPNSEHSSVELAFFHTYWDPRPALKIDIQNWLSLSFSRKKKSLICLFIWKKQKSIIYRSIVSLPLLIAICSHSNTCNIRDWGQAHTRNPEVHLCLPQEPLTTNSHYLRRLALSGSCDGKQCWDFKQVF